MRLCGGCGAPSLLRPNGPRPFHSTPSNISRVASASPLCPSRLLYARTGSTLPCATHRCAERQGRPISPNNPVCKASAAVDRRQPLDQCSRGGDARRYLISYVHDYILFHLPPIDCFWRPEDRGPTSPQHAPCGSYMSSTVFQWYRIVAERRYVAVQALCIDRSDTERGSKHVGARIEEFGPQTRHTPRGSASQTIRLPGSSEATSKHPPAGPLTIVGAASAQNRTKLGRRT
ncbi:hypothetical protein C8Q70DRAFT_631396 [Cubamyces menziesii]|nr:hypothetical protein C8Q70DRAFT_631396 [Cubamyces menziesii]